MWIVAIIVLVGLVGLALLINGVRGRRLDDHPICRACAYDLFGAGEPLWKCPECGRRLDERRALRIGRRRMRPVGIVVGAMLLVLSVGSGTFVGWSEARDYDWNTIMPAWLLRVQIRHGDPAARDASFDELIRRMDRDELADRQVQQVADLVVNELADLSRPWDDRWSFVFDYVLTNDLEPSDAKDSLGEIARAVLEKQQDTAIEWTPEWGERFEWAWQFGAVSASNQQTYVRQGIDIETTIQTPPKSYVGVDVPFRLEHGAYRFSSSFEMRSPLWVRPWRVPVMEGIGLEQGMLEIRHGGNSLIDLSGFASYGPVINKRGWTESRRRLDLPQGRADLEFVVRFFVYRLADTAGSGARPSKVLTPFVEWTRTYHRTMEFVPPDTPIVRMIDDPALEDPVRRSIRIEPIRDLQKYRGTDETPWLQVYLDKPPCHVSFEVFVRLAEEEYECGSVSAEQGSSQGRSFRFPVDKVSPETERLDFVFRPSQDFPGILLDFDEIWGRVLVFEDVLIQEADGAAGKP